MKLNYYRWPLVDAKDGGRAEVVLPPIDPAGDRDPRGYVPHPELVEAVNVAIALGMPLLLTGEPGTGKTELANSVAYQLGFVARSSSSPNPTRSHATCSTITTRSVDSMRPRWLG
jgi:hypothetical protein